MSDSDARPGSDDEATTGASEASSLHPHTIGPYRVLSLLGEGGMGAVYLAEQHVPHRRVAVKVIKAGMDTHQVVARFEAERQALAMMDHSNIAKVLEAGVTRDGRPYFAMEYVAGIPITDYCDQHQLSTAARLALFLPVCSAIQHAHQKGVIHRDIKPSNVLVTLAESRPVPKVIDFGVAKATNQRLTEKTIFTELGVLVGTPEYMSPEQAEMTGLDVDTTTDIYSLGVLLYELLVGALPFDSDRLRRAGYAEIQRIIREEEPARPSTRLTGLGDTAGAVARHHGTNVTSLVHEVRGDLDWITLKAMEKDRTRRYAAVSELAADLQRHLADQPVVARPASMAYRGRKFARRHRAGVAVGIAALLLLFAGGVMTAMQSRRIARERDRAEAVSAFLVSLFEASDPDRSKGEKVSARQLLDRGRERLATELKDEPQTRAALLHVIGRVYRALDLTDAAEAVLTEALELRRSATGRDRADLADTMNELARVYTARGYLDRAESLDRDVLRLRREALGAVHPKVALSMANLGNDAFFREQYDQAEQHYREAVAMAERAGSPDDAAAIRVNLAGALSNLGKLAEAIAVLREAVPDLQRAFGGEHTRTQYAVNNLGVALNRTGQYEEAEKVLREVLRVRRKLLGQQHFDVAVALYNLGNALEGQGRFDEAARVYEECLAIHATGGRQPNMQHAWVLADFALVQLELRQHNRATRTYREAIDMFEKAAHSPSSDVAFAWDGLGSVFYEQGQVAEAESIFRRALGIRQAAGEKPGHGLAESMELLGMARCERGGHEEGERLARESLDIRRNATPVSPASSAFSEAVLGRCLAAGRQFEEAETLLTKAYQTLVERRGPARNDTRYAAASLVALYEAWGKPKAAAEWRLKLPSTGPKGPAS